MNSTTTLYIQRTASVTWASRLGDYLQMAKPRIATLVLVTVAVGGMVATWGQPQPLILLHAVLGTALVAASASIWNQWIERDTDRKMPRTVTRPVPAGRVGFVEVLALGNGTLALGLAHLVLNVNWLTAAVALLTWVIYVALYTPLKLRTTWNTLVGAVPGALPVLIGWSATGQPFDVRAAALFMIVFLWQFPHFMAIAWLYRNQYAGAGIKMITVIDGTGRRAGIQAVVGALALLPVSLVPALLAPPSLLFVITTFTLGCVFLMFAIRFFRERTERSARSLLRVSLIYLPVVMLGLACIPILS